MDFEFVDKIRSALENLNNPNEEEQHQAEATLQESQHIVGYASALLQISEKRSFPPRRKFGTDLNELAALTFASLVSWNWKNTNKAYAQKAANQGLNYVVLDEDDKQYVRDNILLAIFQ